MRTSIPTLLTAAALLGIGAVPARGQDTGIDSRWLAYVGCWEPLASAKFQVCVVPVGASAVDLVKIEKGAVVTRERIDADGQRVATTHGDCTGWQSAAWSAVADRLYIRSANTCLTGGTRAGTGLIAMMRDGQWLYIQGATRGLETGVEVQRYREAPDDLLIPDEIKDALRVDISAALQARAAAKALLSTADVIDASQHVDAAIVEAWLVERGGAFTVDAKRLLTLANAGVPSRTIDVLVALSYPNVFAINGVTRQGERRNAERAASEAGANPIYGTMAYPDCSYDWMLYDYSSYYCDNLYRYGYGYGYGYAYPYGYGFYPGDYPATIIYTGSGGGTHPHGHMVNGQGYQAGTGATGDVTRWGEPRTTPSGTQTGSTASTATPSSTPSSTSTSSSSSGERTAKPRP